MERHSGSWFYNQCTDWNSSNLKFRSDPLNRGSKKVVPDYKKPYSNMVSADGVVPMFSFPEVSHTKASQLTDPCGWFYCFPRFHQTFASLPMGEHCTGLGDSNTNPGSAQKRFVVFDQSGDQTTLIFSSGSGPLNYLPSWSPNPFVWNKEFGMKGETTRAPGQYSDDESRKEDVASEMHEDTEELDALLYSDDDDDNHNAEDDEVTSTGHSPSTMTGCDKQESFEECGEEVASSSWPIKRQKLFNGDYKVPSLMDTASSMKTSRCSEWDDDAKSSCADGQNQVLDESGLLTGNKRSRIEKICETVSILQGIIPGGTEAKDAIGVFDQAICYLRSLKDNAKALGLDSL